MERGGSPPHVHVVVTSRPQPRASNWVPPYHPLREAQVHRLARFGPPEVRALLAQVGRPGEALEVSKAIERPKGKAEALSSVAGAWMGMEREKRALAIAQEAFCAARYGERGDAFSFLDPFASVLASFGPEALAETWRLVEEVKSWWR